MTLSSGLRQITEHTPVIAVIRHILKKQEAPITVRDLTAQVIDAWGRDFPQNPYVDYCLVYKLAVGILNCQEKYDNLPVTGTFSKSRSMAGARLGFGIGSAKLIADLNTVKYSTNPYNVNRLTAAAGIAALEANGYYMNNCKRIQENRAWTTAELEKLGFTVLPSKANFIFAKSDKIGGEELYLTLKEKGILIRHFTKERICDYNRITIGTAEQMKTFIDAVKEIID